MQLLDKDEVVWQATLDNGNFIAQVQADEGNGYTGTLGLFDKAKVLIHSAPVGLAYGALFGPDTSDVIEWQQMVLEWLAERDL